LISKNKLRVLSLFLVAILFLTSLLITKTINANVTNSYDWGKYKGQKRSINVYNWGEYINNEDLDVNNEFYKATGIKVNYTTYGSNEELYARLKGGGVKYDIIIPSDYMVSRLKDEDMLSPINFDNIPNIKNIDEKFLNPSYDEENRYSVPYTWGTVGILYNKKYVKEPIDSWDALWDEKYRGQILMFDNSRDAFSIALKKLGYSVNTLDEKHYRDAKDELVRQKSVIQSYVMDQIFDKMISEEAWIAPYYAGDYITINDSNENIGFSIPKEGTNRFVDAVCIPKNSENKELAEMYINFINEPQIAKANIEYIGYSTPNKGAYALLSDEIKNNEVIYPSDEILENTETFINLPDNINLILDDYWTDVKISDGNLTNKWTMPVLFVLGLILVIFLNVTKMIKRKRADT